jgi:VacB/RNase II family 3'-5' exoribonuclease
MSQVRFDLAASAHEEMIHEGFHPDFSAAIEQQVSALKNARHDRQDSHVRDLRQLLWSSIDNDTSRDLDQIEVAERVTGGILVRIGIADVDADVQMGSPIDQHAASETTSVYTPARTFPMLPEELSTDLTSLSPDEDRAAVVVEMLVADDGSISETEIYTAVVRNRFQLTYNGVGPWLEDAGPAPARVAGSAELQAQLKLQDEAASRIREQRHRLGALEFDRVEATPVVAKGEVTDITARRKNRASDLIEDFMVAANEVMARKLSAAGVSGIRRVVKSPERWPRIVELAAAHGASLPPEPDSGALANFLQEQKQKDDAHYPDLSLAVIKLMGPGEYVLARASDPPAGHFGLAAQDYTHSTAPNRRFADLVTQRVIKAVLTRRSAPYSDELLAGVARNCTLKEDAARKVERTMQKRAAALVFQNRVGQSFHGIVTGVTPKGVFVRVSNPPMEGRLVRGEQGVDVGDQIKVSLLHTDPQRGWIDFGR